HFPRRPRGPDALDLVSPNLAEEAQGTLKAPARERSRGCLSSGSLHDLDAGAAGRRLVSGAIDRAHAVLVRARGRRRHLPGDPDGPAAGRGREPDLLEPRDDLAVELDLLEEAHFARVVGDTREQLGHVALPARAGERGDAG